MSLGKKLEPMQGIYLLWAWYAQYHRGLGLLCLSLTCSSSGVCPELNMLGSRQRAWTHFSHLIRLSSAFLGPDSAHKPPFTPRGLGLSRLRPTCLGPSSVPEPIFTLRGLELSQSSPACLGCGSVPGTTFTSYRLGLWHPSLVYLGPGSALIPIFISDELEYLARAQHSLKNFFETSYGPLSILYWSNTYYFE